MKRKIAALLIVVCATMQVVACGNTAANSVTEEENVENIETETTDDVDVSGVEGTYIYEEAAMGGSFIVPWKLTLNQDGTYVLLEENPFEGNITYTGNFTYDGNMVTTGPLENLDGKLPQADFFEDDYSCVWSIDGENVTPVGGGSGGVLAEGGLPEGGFPMGGPAGESLYEYERVQYASNSEAQTMDIILPEEEGIHPVIVVVHGGGFRFGDAQMELIQPIFSAVEHGYAVVSVDYRKSGEATFPGAVADVKAALRYIRANAEIYGFDVDHIAIWGESAGAYLAVMTALTPEVEELNGDVTDNLEYDSSVQALVDFYGPVEFYTMDEEYAALGVTDREPTSSDTSFESTFLGQNVGEDETYTYTTYPLTYADQLPDDFQLKVWIQVGDADMNVPYTQSENLANALTELLGTENVNFEIIEGAVHEDAAFYTEENLGKIFTYLDAILKSN